MLNQTSTHLKFLRVQRKQVVSSTWTAASTVCLCALESRREKSHSVPFFLTSLVSLLNPRFSYSFSLLLSGSISLSLYHSISTFSVFTSIHLFFSVPLLCHSSRHPSLPRAINLVTCRSLRCSERCSKEKNMEEVIGLDTYCKSQRV